MQAELQAHLAFHLTGQTQAGQLDTIDGLLPAQFANYRELGGLRYDFPLVLLGNATDDGFVLSLSGLIDGILHDVAQGADGERLRQHAFRLEREIRALVAEGTSGTLSALWEAAAGRLAGHNDELLQDSLRRLRAALKLDGDVVDCDKSMPFRLLQHGWKVLREHKARKIGKTIDELIIKLSDILAAEFVNSDQGLSPEQLKEGIGSSQRDAFDFSAMSRLLLECSPRTPLPETRRRRIQGLLSVLKAQRFFPASKQRDRSSRSGSPHDFVFDGSAEAVQAYRARLPEMTELAKALAVAELEVEGRYHAATHDPLFARYGANGLDAEDLELFPDYLIRVRPDEILSVLKAVALGLPAKVLVQSDDLLEPAMLDGEHLALAAGTKQLTAMAIGLGSAFVLQSSGSQLVALREQVSRGLAFAGPAIFNIFSGANAEAGALPAYLSAAAAAESRVFPAFVYDPSAGTDLATRFQLHANQPDLDWPVQELAYEDEAHQRISENLPFTLVDFVACDRRYARHFARVPRAKWNGTLAPVAQFLGAGAAPADKVPCLLMVDRDNVLQKVIVDERLVREARQCAEMWRMLQELGGIHNSHAAKLVAQERKVWAEQLEQAKAKANGAASGAGNGHAAPAEAPAAAAAPAAVEAAAPEPSSDEPYIETPRCSSCNECIQINPQMFAYDGNKQASIVNAAAGTYRQLVEAAESCQVAIIHPGKPKNLNEPGLDELLKRAEAFQ
jgi:ferredoxin